MIGPPMVVEPRNAMDHRAITLPRMFGTLSSWRIVFPSEIKMTEKTPTSAIAATHRTRLGAALAIIAIIVIVISMGSGSAKAPPGVPADWKTYSGKGIRRWLPPAYEVGKS